MKFNSFKVKGDQMIYLVLTGLFTAVMAYVTISHYSAHSFMYDELYTLGFISKDNSFIDMMRIFFTDEVTNPPIYDIFLFFWYRIVPWGEGWMLFPNLIFFVTGLITISRALVRKTGNTRSVLFVFVISWLNPAVFEYMLYYLRCYAMVFMFSAFALNWFMRVQENPSLKNIAVHGLILTCLSLTHYYGAIVTFAFGICDAVLIIMKRKRWKVFCAYLMAGGMTGLYLITAILHRTKNLSSYWGQVPGLNDIWKISWMLLLNKCGIFLFVLVLALTASANIILKEKRISEKVMENLFVFLAVVLLTVGFVFGYGIFINPEGSILIHKYFMLLLPEIVFVFAFSIDYLCGIVRDGFIKNIASEKVTKKFMTYGYIAFMAAFSVLLCSRYVRIRLSEQFQDVPQTRNMTEYIGSDNEVKDKCVLVYQVADSQWDVPKYPVKGLEEYYLEGNSEKVKFVSDLKSADKYDTVYLWYTMFASGAYDKKKKTVNKRVLKDLSEFEVKEVKDEMGMMILKKEA